MSLLSLLLIAHVELQLPPAARCDDHPTRYPAVIRAAPDAFDPVTTKLAVDLAQQDLVIIRSNNRTEAELRELAKQDPCVDQERIHVLSDPSQKLDDLVSTFHAEPEATLPAEQAPFLGITLLPVDLPGQPDFVLRLDRVLPTLPAYEAGLRAGDMVLSLNGENVANVPRRDAAARMTRRIRALAPGSLATFKILRLVTHTTGDASKMNESEPGVEHEVAWTRLLEARTVVVRALVQKTPERGSFVRSPGDNKLASMISALGDMGQENLFKRIADGTVRPDAFRLPIVDALQHDPLALRGATTDIIARSAPSQDGVESLRRLLRVAGATAAASPLQSAISPAQHLAQLRGRLEQAAALRQKALARLSVEEQRDLQEGLPVLAAKYLDGNYVYADADQASLTRNLRTIHLASKLDLQPLLEATALLIELSQPSFIKALTADLTRAKMDLSKAVVLEENTPLGLIRIAGTQDDDANELDKIALLIDLGGNDFYRDHVGTGRAALCVVIDANGDDTYESSADLSLGAGLLGVGILADLAGDDHYLGMRFSEGMGLGGVGVLLDLAGRDVYRASQLGQAASLFGVGILHDASGDDHYEGRSHTQGVAVGGGAALLVDASGNDLYYAKGAAGSPYGTPGTYDCWCQGAGVGMRNLVSGGLGLLYDGGGKDRVEGGDFSQGTGYYFGYGIAAMRGRDNDVYVGDRYTLSASAHNGIAAFVDEGGNDNYATREVASIGLANDYAMAWFFDGDGDDRYSARGACGGVTMNNALSIFEDLRGKDEWIGNVEMATGQGNPYHGGTSLSIVVASPNLVQKTKTFAPFDNRDERTLVFRLGKTLEAIADDAELLARVARAFLAK